MDESDTDLFKPFKYYYDKQMKKGGDNQDITDLIQSWNKLDNEKKLKFIKKAESKFDKEHDDSQTITKDNCFGSYLNSVEFKLLMDSYGFVEKPPQNVRQFFFKKNHQELEEGQNFLIETQKKYLQLTQEDKDKLFDELASMEEDYCRKMTQFLDSLPENRFVDYRKYLQHHEIHPEKKKKSKKKKPKSKTSADGTTPKAAPKRTRPKAIKYMLPYEFYYKKNEEKFLKDNLPAHEALRQARSYYLKNLSNKKKLKFVKKCEEHYDELVRNEAENNTILKPFSSLLNKNELELLFESYGLPKVVPKSATSYYLKVHYSDYASANPDNRNIMALVMNSFKTLDPNAKNEFLQKHQEDLKSYGEKLEIFKRNLPLQRLGDYLRYEGHEKKGETTNGTANNTSTVHNNNTNDTRKVDNKKRKLNEESDHDHIVSEVDTNVEDNDNDDDVDDDDDTDEKEEQLESDDSD